MVIAIASGIVFRGHCSALVLFRTHEGPAFANETHQSREGIGSARLGSARHVATGVKYARMLELSAYDSV
jgi:hypothetical protein